MANPSDPVRTYQLPKNTPGAPYVSQYNIASNAPISITPGFGGSGGGKLPPIHTGGGHWNITITSYAGLAQPEQKNEPQLAHPGGKQGRAAHVKRIFASKKKDKEGGGGVAVRSAVEGKDEYELIEDVWIDVLRADEVPMAARGRDDGSGDQIVNYVVHWNDGWETPPPTIDDSKKDLQDENGNAGRKTHRIKITNKENATDDDPVKLWIVDKLRTRHQTDIPTGKLGQGLQLVFNNNLPTTAWADAGAQGDRTRQPVDRQVNVLKVVHTEFRDLEMSYTDNEGQPVAIPIEWETYQNALKSGEQDTEQYLDVEVTERYYKKQQTDETRGGYVGLVIAFALKASQELNDLGVFGRGDEQSEYLIRTDPLQTIVNVGFGGLAVIFGPQASDAPKQQPGAPALLLVREG